MIRVLILLFLSGCLFASDENKISGLEAYETGHYDKAIAAFSDQIEAGETAAARHNLALAYYQSGSVGEAVWQLERALRLAPFNEAYHFKRAALREELGLPDLNHDWATTYQHLLSPSGWVLLASLAFWTLAATIVLPRCAGCRRRLPVKLLLVLSCGGLLLAGPGLYLNKELTRQGICISDNPVELRAAPAAAAPPAGRIRPGERGRKTEQHNDYVRIQSEANAEGWLPASHFRLLH